MATSANWNAQQIRQIRRRNKVSTSDKYLPTKTLGSDTKNDFCINKCKNFKENFCTCKWNQLYKNCEKEEDCPDFERIEKNEAE